MVILGYVKKEDEEKVTPPETPAGLDPIPSGREPDLTERAMGVVEQRVSNLVQGSLCLILMTGPFLHVLNLIPRGELHCAAYGLLHCSLFSFPVSGVLAGLL